MHLDEAVLVGRGRRPVDDEERDLSVLLDLRPLAEVLGVLDRQRVEPEHVPQEAKLLLARPVDVEPEELAVVERRLDGRRGRH